MTRAQRRANLARCRALFGGHHITPEFKARVRSLLELDLTAKAVALEIGMSDNSACRWARALGFRMMYVTDEERAHLMSRRSTALPFADLMTREASTTANQQ